MKKLNGLRNSYTPEYKANIVREILREEKSVAQIAAEHGIHPHQLYQWRDQALAGIAHHLFRPGRKGASCQRGGSLQTGA